MCVCVCCQPLVKERDLREAAFWVRQGCDTKKTQVSKCRLFNNNNVFVMVACRQALLVFASPNSSSRITLRCRCTPERHTIEFESRPIAEEEIYPYSMVQ
jgi:hypothetical protein